VADCVPLHGLGRFDCRPVDAGIRRVLARADEGTETVIGAGMRQDISGLQWGRADEGAETAADLDADEITTMLQWGRADEGAETPCGRVSMR